jgi:uncharacterized protein with von Willebrand factor type A (vWA) domain
MIDKKLLEFFTLLRKNNVRVSPAEVIDAFEVLKHIEILDRNQFKSAIRSTVIKDYDALDTFDELFDIFFSDFKEHIKFRKFTLDDIPFFSLSTDYLKKIISKEFNYRFSPILAFILSGDSDEFLRAIQSASEKAEFEKMQNHLQINFFTNQLYLALGGGEVEADFFRIEKLLREMNVSPEELESILKRLREASDNVRNLIKEYVGKEFKKLNFNYFFRIKRERLLNKDFTALTDTEVAELKKIINELGEKLRNREVIKRKLHSKGKLEIRKTLRRNFKYGGEIVKPLFSKKVKHKPKIFVLCDVSDSVRYVSSFFLQFIYSLQSMFKRVSSFIFAGNVGEVTSLFLRYNPDEALRRIYKGEVINPYAKTNYGHVFRTIQREYLGRLDRTTTVIIIGDGRNNHNPPEEHILDDIRRVAKNLIWLCPENRWGWWMGDSEMLKYSEHCDDVKIVTNLADLYRAVQELLI